MRIKDLFTVPEGTKVTEKMFSRVLISSVCSILLCIACLSTASWAWFTAGVESTVDIQIAPVTLETRVTLGTQTVDALANGSYSLEPGQYQLELTLEREEPKYTAYVLVSVRHKDTQAHYFFPFPANAGKTQAATLTVAEAPAVINFQVTWISPAAAVALENGDTITLGQPESVPQETTGATEEATLPTQETDPIETTAPVETTAPTTDASEPVETTAPTEATTGEDVPETQDPAPSEDPLAEPQQAQPAEPPVE